MWPRFEVTRKRSTVLSVALVAKASPLGAYAIVRAEGLAKAAVDTADNWVIGGFSNGVYTRGTAAIAAEQSLNAAVEGAKFTLQNGLRPVGDSIVDKLARQAVEGGLGPTVTEATATAVTRQF